MADLLQLAEDAVAGGADVLGMAGGDGSQALVASVASRYDLPFVVVPAGTRNHFALDLGIDREDVVGALDAFTEGVEQVIDLAEVNGRVFVNNASMGVYAKIVQSDDYRDAKMHTTAEMLPQLLGPDATPLDLRFDLPDGREATTAQLILVSNNSYQLGGLRGSFTRHHWMMASSGWSRWWSRECRTRRSSRLSKPSGRAAGTRGWTSGRPLSSRSGRPAPSRSGSTAKPSPSSPRSGSGSCPPHSRSGCHRRHGRSPHARPAVHITSRDTLAALWRTALGRPVTP